MKLRTKLLLGVGCLLLAMILLMYVLPSIFVRRDIHKAVDELHDLVNLESQQLANSQEAWLKDALENMKENNNALLYKLYEEPLYSAQLTFAPQNTTKEIWTALARVAGYDPSIGFVQLHSPDDNKAAVISPNTAPLYSINKITQQGSELLVSLLPTANQQESQTFAAFPLQQTEQQGYIFYLLFPAENAEHPKEPRDLQGRSLQVRAATAFQWAIKIDMIRKLAPYYVEGFPISTRGTLIPEGIMRVDKSGEGYALLTKEVFSAQPLFDDALYYKQHLPPSPSPPLASGSAILTVRDEHSYLSNTLLLGKTYLTIASPIHLLVRQLALASNETVLLMVNHNLWHGYDGKGNRLSSAQIEQMVSLGTFDHQRGLDLPEGYAYFFKQVSSLDNDQLIFFDVHTLGEEKTIISTLLSLKDKLSSRISTQLFLAAAITMLLVLLFIGRLGLTVIYPVTKLASSTQLIVQGRYEEVELPDVGNRQDEVAILTRSFEEMVRGLQEREKIRAVLDKVVSKDVADEILRSQIHLGGEDRIVTMLFCDIRDFSSITTHLTPQKTIEVLNACMTKVSRVIEGEGGVIDKYVGDEVMAIFGAPTTHPDHALRAVSTGMLIVETLKKWNQTRAEKGEVPIEMGIGIHTGLVVAGNMGAEDRLNYTVLGTHVNLAARLCEVSKRNQLIISEATLAEPNIKESFYTEALPPITLKGFAEPVPIYEIAGFKWG